MSEATDAPPIFSTVLHPHRSASLRGIHVVMIMVGVLWTITGLSFFAAGAWPVFGLLGCEGLLLYAALRIGFRRGRAFESIDLTEDALTVRHTDHRGRVRMWSASPHRLEVEIEESPGRHDHLMLRAPEGAHDRAHDGIVAVGAFLNAEERRDLANALRQALAGLHVARAGKHP